MNALVLAFESMEDLPKNWERFDSITAYGPANISKSIEEAIKSQTILVMRKLFSIRNFEKPDVPYDYSFIRHPDPWGEPRSWMQAISALGESLQGRLECEFWFTHEIPAFHYLLISLLGNDNIDFKEMLELDSIGNKPNYMAVWEVNTTGIKEDMLEFYEKNKTNILSDYYRNIGQDFDMQMSLEDAKAHILPDDDMFGDGLKYQKSIRKEWK